VDQDLALAGIKPPPKVAAEGDGEDFEVWEENWEVCAGF